MKKTLLVAFIALLTYSVQAQIFEETFDDVTNQDWSFYNLGANIDTTQNWRVVQYWNKPFGDSSFYHSGYLSSDNWAVTPQIDLTVDAFLSFEEYNTSMWAYDYSGVLISTGSGDPNDGEFVELFEADEDVSEFTERRVNLQLYKGQQVYLAFNYQGSWDHEWYLDNIIVDTVPDRTDLSISTILADQYTLGLIDSLGILIQNIGGNTIPVNTQIDMYVNGTLSSSEFTVDSLLFGEIDTVYFDWVDGYGNFDISFIKTVSDDSTANDTLEVTGVAAGSTSIIESMEELNPFQYKYSNSGDYKSHSSGSNSYHGNYYMYFDPSSSYDTLNFNRFVITDSSFFSVFFESSIVYNCQLLSSEDGMVWDTVNEWTIDSTDYVQLFSDFSSIDYDTAYLKLVSYTSHFWPRYNIDYLLLPEEAIETPSCDDVLLYTEEFNHIKNISLNWDKAENASIALDGMFLSVGTDGDGLTTPGNILHNISFSNKVYYFDILDYSTNYYVQISPYNSNDTAVGCPIHTFTTPDEPFLFPDTVLTFETDETLPLGWSEDFDVWSDSLIINDQSGGLHIDDFVNNWDSSQCLQYNFWSTSSHWAVSPKIVLGTQAAYDSLFIKLGVTDWGSTTHGYLGTDDTLAILISDDEIWRKSDTVAVFTYRDSLKIVEHLAFDISDYNDTIQFAFYTRSTVSNVDIDLSYDDITITRNIPEPVKLDSIIIGGEALANFSPDIMNYEIVIPNGMAIDSVWAYAQDTVATIEIAQLDNSPGTVAIDVWTNPMFKTRYTITYIARYASLTTLVANGDEVPGFASNNNSYVIIMPNGTAIDTVWGIANDTNATVVVSKPDFSPGTATVDVYIHPDLVTTYTIVFRQQTIDINDNVANQLKVYPNPAQKEVHISGTQIDELLLLDIGGSILIQKQNHASDVITLNIEDLKKGIYFISIKSQNQTFTQKLIVQ